MTRILGALALAVLLAAPAAARPPAAAIFRVTHSADSGAGSLRQAILDANAAGSADTVGLASITWTNSAGGSGTALGLDLWAAAVPLVEGTNVITVTATDELTVEYSPATQTTVVNEGDDCGLLGAEMIGLWLGPAWLRRRVRRA